MVTVPAFVWRGGFLSRALTIGVPVGLALGVLAWLDSGSLIVGALVLILVGTFYGIWMPRRMARYWPGASTLGGDDRVAVVRAVRRGQHLGEERLAQAVRDYRDGLHAAAEKARQFRWLVLFLLLVAVGTAVWDAVFGSWATPSLPLSTWWRWAPSCSGGRDARIGSWPTPTAPWKSDLVGVCVGVLAPKWPQRRVTRCGSPQVRACFSWSG